MSVHERDAPPSEWPTSQADKLREDLAVALDDFEHQQDLLMDALGLPRCARELLDSHVHLLREFWKGIR